MKNYLLLIVSFLVISCANQIDNIDVIASDPIYSDYMKLHHQSALMITQDKYDFEQILEYIDNLPSQDPCDKLEKNVDLPGVVPYLELRCSINRKIDELDKIYNYKSLTESTLLEINDKFNQLTDGRLQRESIEAISPQKN